MNERAGLDVQTTTLTTANKDLQSDREKLQSDKNRSEGRLFELEKAQKDWEAKRLSSKKI